MMKKLFTLLAAMVFISTAFAQSPQKMSYQAVIRNAGEQLINNHSVGMKISILQGSAAGTVVYTEIQTPTTNANGLATVEIGSGTIVTGTFSGIDWSAGPYYLKVQTDPGGGTDYTITGTSQLLSVPYALYSANAGNSSLWSLIGNNIYYNSGNVGIGSAEPVGKLEVVSQDALRLVGYQPFLTLLDANADNARSRIQGVAGDLSLLTESYLSGVNPFSFLKLANNGNVGIGSAEPVGRLEVVGQDALRLVGYQPFLTLHDANAGYARGRIQVVAGDLSLFTESYLSGVNTFSFLKLANNGNVGIGSAEPVGKLEVVGQDALRLVGYQPFLTLLDANAGYTRGRIQSANGNILFYPESFIVGGSPAVTIFSGSGNVGIGTPKETGYKLSVVGKIICEELKVQLAGNWPDYVFDKKYELMPLDELAKNIEQEKHLPGLPSAADVQQDGISVGEMQSKLLEKVEQLTLYVIQLQKQNAELVKKDAEIMKLINNSIECNH
jgi:hypothetical protein